MGIIFGIPGGNSPLTLTDQRSHSLLPLSLPERGGIITVSDGGGIITVRDMEEGSSP